ncbi:single-stranded-DNA-specific exonuclease RecJ [Patescibacteria group bacterium]|nr:single-stranded-DNA-specific exonuclease RecJ [Patescibacteria group bacterium]
MEKTWQVAKKISGDFKNKFPEISPIILQLLFNRGLDTQEKIDEFLLPDYSQDLHDPFLFQDMVKAVDRIYQAIDKKEKIVICGDYDTDGITALAILFFILKGSGAESLSTYIPDREGEGYGLNKQAVENFIQQGIDLIITCDCGITSVEEIDLANKAGLEVIVSDHHCQPKQLPRALAIINPQLNREKYPYKYLAGVGVAFKLAQALLSDKRCKIENKEATEKWLLDLVALGTVADYMPLLGENRTLVKYGLVVLNKTSNLGIRSLIEKSGLELGALNTGDITYQLSPRLNAAARIKHADEALNMILADDRFKADELAEHLNSFNLKRQQLVETTFQEIKSSVGPEPKEVILVTLGKDWPRGVIGLSANKLVDQYNRPAIVLTCQNDEVVGSGRSIPGFNLHQTLSQVEKYFARFGGHPGAIGLTLKNPDDFESFKKEVLRLGQQKLKPEALVPKIKIDIQVNLEDIDWPLYEELVKFEPFGRDNFQPNFLIKNVSLNDIQMVGQNGRHCRLMVGQGRKMIYFGANHKMKGLKTGDKADIIFQLGINQWNGQQELQMKVIDLRKST